MTTKATSRGKAKLGDLAKKLAAGKSQPEPEAGADTTEATKRYTVIVPMDMAKQVEEIVWKRREDDPKATGITRSSIILEALAEYLKK